MEKHRKKKTKIMYIITKGNWGGAQKYVYNLATQLKDKFDIVVVFGEGEKLKENLEKEWIKTIRARKLKNKSDLKWGVFAEIREIIKTETPDIVHLNSSKAGLIGAMAAKNLGIKKIIFTAHGWAFNDASFFWQRIIFRLAQWITVLLSHKTITVSQSTKKDIADWTSVTKKVTTIYNGVEKIEFLKKKEAREKLLPEKKGGFWIGTIAELHKNKGLDILIKSFTSLENSSKKKIYLVIIGEGREKEALEKLARNLGVRDRVFFLDFLENAGKFLKAFDLFVLSSRTEGLPFAILEAGLAKLPIIASNVGGIPEIIKKDSGIIIEKENPVLLKEKIEFLMNNPKERRKLGSNLEKIIKSDFSIEKMANKTLLMYNSKKIK